VTVLSAPKFVILLSSWIFSRCHAKGRLRKIGVTVITAVVVAMTATTSADYAHWCKTRRQITRTHARARDPHSSEVRVGLMARPSSLPHHSAPARSNPRAYALPLPLRPPGRFVLREGACAHPRTVITRSFPSRRPEQNFPFSSRDFFFLRCCEIIFKIRCHQCKGAISKTK